MDERKVSSAIAEISRRRVLAAGALGVASLVLPSAAGRAAEASGPMFVYAARTPKTRRAEAATIPLDFQSSGSMRRQVRSRRSSKCRAPIRRSPHSIPRAVSSM